MGDARESRLEEAARMGAEGGRQRVVDLGEREGESVVGEDTERVKGGGGFPGRRGVAGDREINRGGG